MTADVVCDTARSVAIQHEITRRADEIRRSLDPAVMPQTQDEWTARLVGSLGCVACAADHGEVQHYVIEHAATVVLWLENLEREAAR
jgi:hypothetical protein